LRARCPELFADPTTPDDAGSDLGWDAGADEVDPDPFLCGGAYRDPCAPGKYCAWSDGCGTVGYCTPRDLSCEVESPVCGCDGETYASECAAGAQGVGLAHSGPCTTERGLFACGDFTCEGTTYCLDQGTDLSDPDQQRFVCLALPANIDSCADADALAAACFGGATCAESGGYLTVTCN
jgi:hypothetical protein